MASKGFDLAAALAEVSELDTTREQITYVDLDLLDDDPNNFYSTDAIDALAESIEFLGLQQPLRVRPNPEAAGRYIIVSGHRRRLAVRMIVDGGNDKLRQVPCIIEQPAASSAMQELRLIYANSDTRTMTSADKSKQAERVEALLYELQQQGVEFPGRMRDHVAEVCKVSASKLARLKVIREKLHPLLRRYWEAGTLKEATAYACARAGKTVQDDLMYYVGADKVATWYEWTCKDRIDRDRKIRKRECQKRGGGCVNVDAMLCKALNSNYCECEYYCCAECPHLSSCRSVCSVMAGKAADLKQQRKEAVASAKLTHEEDNRRKAESKRIIWQRWDAARRAANKTVEDGYRAGSRTYGSGSEEQALGYADGSVEVKYNTSLPYGWHDLEAYEPLLKTADLFGCTVDFLLGRSDELQTKPESPQPESAPGSTCTWHPGVPDRTGDVTAILQLGNVIQTRCCYYDSVVQAFYFRRGGQQIDGVTCLGWLP